MIILINGGHRSPTGTDLDAMAKACGTADWLQIGLALGSNALTDAEVTLLGEEIFSLVHRKFPHADALANPMVQVKRPAKPEQGGG